MRLSIILSFFFIIILNSKAQELSGSEIIEKSIEFHDPDNIWSSGHFMSDLKESRPNGPSHNSLVEINNLNGFFYVIRYQDGHALEYTIKDGECIESLDWNYVLSEAEIEEYNLTCERSNLLRDCYTYLWGMPMKLKDPGTIISNDVDLVQFNEEQVLSVQVTYREDVGSDTWYFYFHPENYSLVGYRFYHVEEENDGEYIILTDLLAVGSMKIPKSRKWFINIDDKFLGEDILENIRTFNPEYHQ